MNQKKDFNVSRRDLLKSATVAISSFALANLDSGNESLCSPVGARTSNRPSTKHDTIVGMKFPARDVVRVGIVGVGGRGTSLLRDLLAIENVQITAICDIAKDKALSAQSAVEKSGQKPPALYHGNERDFENLCKR